MLPAAVICVTLVAHVAAYTVSGASKPVKERYRNLRLKRVSELGESLEKSEDYFTTSKSLIKRADCGPSVGSCAAGQCCSSGGVCGTGPNYCSGPDCQFKYGPACDANTVPAGTSTAGIARPKVGNVPYGVRINDCTLSGRFALTFDDGPFAYTNALLDLLDQYNAKATFFITGNNLGKSPVDDCTSGYPAIIKRIFNSGHQVASHTWTHQNLNSLSTADFNNQMIYNEMALRNILGVIPTYFRPPYVDCNSACFAQLGQLGYHVIYYDLDTFDYANDSPNLIQNSKNYFSTFINPQPADGLVLSHDTHAQTVYNLTKFMLDTLASKGYGTSVTVGSCLGDPAANWYRSAGSTTTCSSPPPLVVSTQGNCTAGITCQGSQFGNCCSRYNFCGSTSEYCGTGCQPGFGTCGLTSSSPSSSVSSQSSTSRPPSSSPTTSLQTSSRTTSSTTPLIPSTTRISTQQTTRTTSQIPATTTSSLSVSQNGRCGTGVTCLNSVYGNCCSRYGYCGTSVDHCGSFCQPAYGSCNAANPSATPRVSTDGSCSNGITCSGSTYGTCCSRYGFCGSDATYCGTGCQPLFGSCT